MGYNLAVLPLKKEKIKNFKKIKNNA